MTDTDNTSTEGERAVRAAVRRAVGGVLFNASNFPERVQTRLLGQDMGPLNEKITDAVIEAIARSSETLTIPRPHVPYGPIGVPEHEADADYLDHAASNLEGRYEVGGSNVRATVVRLLRHTAAALRAAGSVR